MRILSFRLLFTAALLYAVFTIGAVTWASVTPQIAVGYSYSIALKSDGTVWAWGANGSTNRSTPVQFSELSNVTAVACGYSHTIVLKSDGTAWAWGYNEYGQLGDGTTTYRYTPVQVSGLSNVIAIACGYHHTIALKSDGTVWAWGSNGSGNLGDGTTTQRNTPVQVSGLIGVTAIAGGGAHTAALKSDGTMWVWGSNAQGQLGDGTTTKRTTPVQASSLSGVTAIACGGDHTFALKSDGTVWGWGNNDYGQLGDGATTQRTTPVQASSLSGVTAIACRGLHTIALKSDGTVWAWGYNYFGQLGDGTATQKTTPVQVSGLSGVTAIAVGASHTAALKSDGTVWAWGYNYFGQLGDGTTTNRSTPVQVKDLNLYTSATPTPTPSPTPTSTATPPTVTTGTYQITSDSSSQLFGTVNPNGLSTTGWFEWGTTSSYGNTTSAESLGGGTSVVQLLHTISGLSANTTYHFRAAAQNSAGTSYGEDMTFTTSGSTAVPPTVTTNTATSVSSTSATLNGTVNPNGASTTGWFEWGTTASYGNTTQTFSGGSGSSDVSMSWSISDLLPDTTYHFRAVGQNSAGTTYGSDMSFTTSGSAATTPTVATGIYQVTSSSSAYLFGTVNPNGLSTTGWFEWGTTSSYGNTTNLESLGSGIGVVQMLHTISGLSASTTYHFRVVGQSSAGTSYGDDMTFTMPDTVATVPPTATTKAATSVSSSSATLNGSINPNGASTTGWFEWGTTASYGNTTQTFSGGSGTSDVTMSWALSSLSQKTTYHFRAVGQNSAGTSYGSDMSFTTSSSGTQPTVKTGTATDVTSSTATLNGTVNANGLSTTAEFVYRLNGSYSKSWRTSRQTVSGSSDTSVGISISGLSPGTDYYYRIEAENSDGRSYGKGSTFTTLKASVTPKPSPTPTPKTDTTAPSGSININSGASYTNSTTANITLSATDSVGVTGYYLSASSSTPVATASGWNSVTSTISYSGNASYSLSSGNGSKTIYVWYKDAAGNVSKPANDSIILDTTAPVLTITNPTANSNYTATSSAINLGGSASDNTSGVSSVTWSNNTGGSGKANGTTNWSISNVSLSNGENTITVTATDNAGNSGTDTLLVTYSAASEKESLLEKYAPVLYMHPDERFYPIDAEVMLANSNLYNKEDGTYTSFYDSALTSVDYLMKNYNDSTYYLKLKDDWDEDKDEDFWKSSPTIYGRQFDNGGYTVLQYWFFYIYNDWDDIHEGDWEMIQIILKENDETKIIEPKMITYSIHLGGKTFLWDDSRVRKEKTHPLVYVTLGGHGSWNKAGDNVWFQGYGACLKCTDETLSTGDVLVPSTMPVTSDEYKKYQLENLSDVSKEHWIYWQGYWGDRNIKKGIQKLKLPMTGPSSPPYIDYINKVKKGKKSENGRWYKPITWAKKPKPSYYTICATVNTKVTVHEFDTNITNVFLEHCFDLNTCGNCPSITFVYSEKDLVFDVYSLDGKEVDLRISRHKRTGNVCEAVFNGVEIPKEGKASFTFSPEQNPTLEIGIDHDRDGIFDSHILPDFLEVNE